jgi:outer membrane autotransporter protein
LTGTYGFPEQVLTPFLSLRDSYDARNAYLTVVQTQTAGSIGTSPNEVEVGKSIDSLPGGDPVQSGVYNQASIDAAQRALNQLSGEIHASAKTALIEDSWLLRAAVNDRLRSAFGSVGSVTLNYGYSADLAPSVKGPMPLPQTDRFAVWGQGYGSWGRTDSDGNAAKLKRSTGGFLVGADAAVFDNLRFGVVAGYSRSDFDVNSRLSSGESDNYHLGLYGGGQWGALNLRAGANYTWHDIETRRAVTSAFLGSIPRASYDAATAQVFGEVGYRIELGRAAFEPFAGLAYVNLHSDGFNETGAATALTGRGDDTGVGYSTLGLRAATSLDLQGMAVTLRGGLAWRHAFGDVDPKARLAFAGSSTFTVAGLPIARDAAMVEAGLDLAIGRNATLGVSYNGQLAEDTQDHSFKGVLAVRF